ncbi:CDP-glycerol glycerophosphotransferase family protein [Glutamicibacter sp. MNS18]|uniref:CDP-glycerol glycerophosphotransferase family protein n=1 Tax=Glutamicibacter sp. MNS18 TaxID=2989817 RepID=UPI0022361E3F|nr:CDP-glycerol glycerophosphotransferase family protein [Glutamicibacter sp. MNS18]MCW4463905.1 CDP-glycerol glycerophosphotransferase family protein [Glutamicibacter sp. MNS18]
MSLISRQLSLAVARARALAAEPGLERRIAHHRRELHTAETVLFFSEPPSQIYQLEVWLAPFERLAAAGHRVGIVVMNALTATALLEKTTLPVFYSRNMEQVEHRLRSAGTRAICYVNNAQANFTMLRFNGPRHIHLNHGESEKSSMVSNQLKAYDQVAVAGAAALERIGRGIARFDAGKLVPIGRPQLDAVTASPGRGRVRVLYAPTWEGDSKAMGYSSLLAHGEDILAGLCADERIDVRFRPHPKTGGSSAAMAKLIASLRRKYAALLDPVDDAGQSLADSDVVICDISAMAYDALALNIPLLLAGTEECELTKRLPASQQLADCTDLAERVLALAATGSTVQGELARYFFATTAAGEATELLRRLVCGEE